MEVVKIVAVAVSGCVITVILNQHKPEYALFARLAVIMLIGIAVFDSFSHAASDTLALADGLRINGEYILLLIKALAISVVFGIVSDICSDTGNKAIATCVDLAGRLCVMLLAIPLLSALMQLAKELIKQ